MSENVEETKPNIWNSSNLVETTLTEVTTHPMGNPKTQNYLISNNVCLVLTVPPEPRFRYRYDTEMSGTHGSLQGIRNGRDKCVPTVQLLNYPHEALIRVSLVTCLENEEPYPHPHSLFVREKLYQKNVYENRDGKGPTKTGHYTGPHYIRVGGRMRDHTARFEGMCIINSKKENFHSSVRGKMLKKLEENKSDTLSGLGDHDITSEKIEKAVNCVDVDFVRLCFEALREENGRLHLICPPIYSEPIGNAKSAKTGKLKISRINKCSGSCKGGDEIWMLVEKISKKGLIVRFWEECNGKTIWQSSLEGDDLILHHQYAIIFKTPAYRDANISSEVEVCMRLERLTQPHQPCDYSEPITFVYEPFKRKSNKGGNLYRKESILTPLEQVHVKRPRTDSSGLLSCNHVGNCDCDDLEFTNMSFEDSTESYIEQILFSDKDSIEFDQAWAKFNVEEFLQFLSSDDVDMPLQRDGVALNGKLRERLYKIYLLYSKLDENDIRKLTEDVSNFRVSKKGLEGVRGRNAEKDQVKDAASTLLSLRSKAMAKKSEEVSDKSLDNNNISSGCFLGLDDNEPGLIRTSVIKKFMCKPVSAQKDEVNLDIKKNVGDDERDDHSEKIKQEVDTSCNTINLNKLNVICDILNEGGSWKDLAEMWDCEIAVSEAKLSSNPAKYIFQYAEAIHGGLDVDVLKQLLQAINETKALQFLEKIVVS